MTNPLRNGADPLHKTNSELEKEIFMKFGELANGFPTQSIVNAAMNIVITAIRQSESGRRRAEKCYDEISGRFKNILLEKHYDELGNRRNVYPYDQVLKAEELLFRNKQKWE